MKIQAHVEFHNKFRIERLDANTKELKQIGYAKNIILNRAFDRVCQFASYFSYIHYGDGVGDLNPARVVLFSPVGYKLATIISSENAYPVSQVTKMIELGTQDNNNKTLREVAISEVTNNINTHALIRDAEGAPLGIPKTQDDIIRIYATVFIELVHPSDTFKFIGFPNNAIASYFRGHIVPSNNIVTDKAREFNNNSTHYIQSVAGTRTNGDKNNRKVNIKKRFLIAESNEEIKGIGLLDSLKVILPDEETYKETVITDKTIGVGDGETVVFNIPNTEVENLVLKINDSIVSNYNVELLPVVEYTSQYLLETGAEANGIAISHDKELIVTASRKSPYFTVQKLDTTTGLYKKMQDLTSSCNDGRNVAISQDKELIITTGIPIFDADSAFSVLRLSEDTGLYERLQYLPGVGLDGSDVAISQDKVLIVTASFNNPYFVIHKLDTTTGLYEKVQELSGTGSGEGYVVISQDKKLIVTSSNSGTKVVTVQKLNEETGLYEKVQELSGTGSDLVNIDLSHDKKLILTASNKFSPYFTVHELDTVTGLYEKLQNLSGVGNQGKGIAISHDKELILTTSSLSPKFTVQKFNAETGLYEALPNIQSSGNTNMNIAHSQDMETIVVADIVSGFRIQKLFYSGIRVIFEAPPDEGNVITADYKVPYIPKDDKHELEVEFEINFAEGV